MHVGLLGGSEKEKAPGFPSASPLEPPDDGDDPRNQAAQVAHQGQAELRSIRLAGFDSERQRHRRRLLYLCSGLMKSRKPSN